MLFEVIKKKYPTAILEYEVKLPTRKVFLDIAVPELKLNFEYDGMHWHTNQKKSKYNDTQRDKELTDLGWTVFRFQYYNNPTTQQLREEFQKC